MAYAEQPEGPAPDNVVTIGGVEMGRRDVDPDAILPGVGTETLDFTSDERTMLAEDLMDVVRAYDQSMTQRKRRWRQIQRAYDMMPETAQQGEKYDASRLVSELTRSYTNIARSRMVEGILGVTPMMDVTVLGQSSADPETEELLNAAKEFEEFVEESDTLALEEVLSSLVADATRLGDAIGKVCYRVREETRPVRRGGEIKTETTKRGEVYYDEIAVEDFIAWPLTEKRTQELSVAGYRSYMTPAEFRWFAEIIELPKGEIDELIDLARGRTAEDRENLREEQKARDIEYGHNPFDGSLCVLELWCHLPTPRSTKPVRFQAFILESQKRLLWVGRNPLPSQRVPFFKFAYWPEARSYWGTGVGHEVLFPHLADSALWNMTIDNLKVTGNYVQIIRAGSMADAHKSNIGPGRQIVTEEPEDFNTQPLGGELPQIQSAIQANDHRSMRATGITAPVQGFGDPVLKSGASPSSLQQLISQSGKKFGEADRNVRRGVSEMMSLTLEYVEHFLPEGVYYERRPEESAALMERVKFQPVVNGMGISNRVRLSARAPSASSNSEVLKQNIMVLYRLGLEHFQWLMQAGQQAFGSNPEGYRRLVEEMGSLVHRLFVLAAELQEIPNIDYPDTPKPTQQDQIINQLQQQLQQVTQEYQGLESQMNQMMQAAQGGQPDPQQPPQGGGGFGGPN